MREAEWLACEDPEAMVRWLRAEGAAVAVSHRKWWHMLVETWRIDLSYAFQTDDKAELRTRELIAKKLDVAELYADGLATGAEVMRARHPGLDIPEHVEFGSPSREMLDYVRCDMGKVWNDRAAPVRVCHAIREIVGNPWKPVSVRVRPGDALTLRTHPDYRMEKAGPGDSVNAWAVSHQDAEGNVVVEPANAPSNRATWKMALPPWLTPTVLSIAQAAYDERDWGRLPVLADALEEAGMPTDEKCPNPYCWGDGMTDVAGGYPVPCLCHGTPGRVPNPLLEHLRGEGPHCVGCWAVDVVLGLN